MLVRAVVGLAIAFAVEPARYRRLHRRHRARPRPAGRSAASRVWGAADVPAGLDAGGANVVSWVAIARLVAASGRHAGRSQIARSCTGSSRHRRCIGQKRAEIGAYPSCQDRRADAIARKRSGLAALFRSGANRDRTGDLLLAKQALSQLSYGPAAIECSRAESRDATTPQPQRTQAPTRRKRPVPSTPRSRIRIMRLYGLRPDRPPRADRGASPDGRHGRVNRRAPPPATSSPRSRRSTTTSPSPPTTSGSTTMCGRS